MSSDSVYSLDTEWIVSTRPERNKTDPLKPYDWFVEKELCFDRVVKNTGTIFLSNKECSFKCLMCDLWKNTLTGPTPSGAIPHQIESVLPYMKEAKQLKLYNSGSFFDEKSIPHQEYEEIASLVSRFETVIVEGHPSLINKRSLYFNDMLSGELEVAIGLETIHPEILRKLNKKMTVEDFSRAVDFLNNHKIRSRAFILLRPPFMNEEEGVYWAKRSIEFAFEKGVECCTVIPVRAGNGAMDLLMAKGEFSKPSLESLEEVLDFGISLRAGRVFADTWDLHLFSKCEACFDKRRSRLDKTNLNQEITQKVSCSC
ncbi:hypothetical protein LCM02_00455 [Lutimonas saemankumensis]|uniref:radical SAM protein n=1 Tax=Lutimonas saemankumensis TaxID=483016 RepID=UPI001CD599FD|nr:hypothetical protein [Lutimonas saemankumensis]MCA0930898.1 hypothetical protein [Lutimonas saemankumensis]